ncbi:MAG TPA: 2OG-Fe(II) oxygenase [Bryobacteraceae bacterium]|nr:2OG-Fe(II) oxygenase [Bryobacteraceae bacterium]
MLSPESTPSPAPLAAIPQVSSKVVAEADAYRQMFIHAWPFQHLAIDDFFEASFAERLLVEFPRFDPQLARNEMGEIGGKAVNTRIREISPAYRELYDTIGGKPFLEMMGRISGIPELILDPRMYGGGTHENLHGQELDPHVDFNYDEAQQLHRRLNVIVYLNKGWRTEWGGAIEIHSNPRDPATNRIRGFDPIFNRCVMFETNEISWHGFPKIDLPPEQRDMSRKSISIYLYTKTRPAEEVAPLHGTFYVQRPLPDRMHEGRALTLQDVADLKELLWRRDIWIQHYQKMELDKNREIAEKNQGIRAMIEGHTAEIATAKVALAALEDELQRHQEAPHSRSEQWEFLLRNIRVPITGYAVQTQTLGGVHADLWTGPHAELEIQPLARMHGIRLRGWRPQGSPAGTLRMSSGKASAETRVSEGVFTLDLRVSADAGGPLRVAMECDPVPQIGTDARELSFRLVELRCLHPLLPLLAKVLR